MIRHGTKTGIDDLCSVSCPNEVAEHQFAINTHNEPQGVPKSCHPEGENAMDNKTGCREYTTKLLVMEGCFLQSKFPLTALGCVITQASKIAFNDLFERWIRSTEERTRLSLAWVKDHKSQPAGRVDIALIAKTALYCYPAEDHWRKFAAGFPVTLSLKPYRGQPCSLDHVVKRLDASINNVEFSDNLENFAIEANRQAASYASAQRRRRTRSGGSIIRPERGDDGD
jgi:hypothetical protein